MGGTPHGWRYRPVAVVLASLSLAAGSGTTARAYPRPGATELITSKPDASRAASGTVAITPDGRDVAFATSAALVPSDVDQSSDVYVFDRWTSRIRLVSKGLGGTPAVGACPLEGGNRGSFDPVISADGRYVAFASCATNLVPGDADLSVDVFRTDLHTDTTVLVSVAGNGHQYAGGGMDPSMSADGRTVSFVSSGATAPGTAKVYAFVRDIAGKSTVLGSVDASGLPAPTQEASLSASGRYLVFNDEPRYLWERDLLQKRSRLVVDGAPGGAWLQGSPYTWVSSDGRYVLFPSDADGLVPNDTNNAWDLFVRDMRTGRFERVSVTSYGEQADSDSGIGMADSITAAGRYVAYVSNATDLGNRQRGASCFAGTYTLPDPNCGEDVFLYDRLLGTNELVSVGSGGGQARCPQGGSGLPAPDLGPASGPIGAAECISTGAGVTADGRYVAFASAATNLLRRSTSPGVNVFVRDLGLELGASLGRGSPGGASRGTGPCPAPLPCPAGSAGSADPANRLGPALAREGADLIRARAASRPESGDVFVREELRTMASVSGTPAGGDPGIVYGLDLTADGVPYEVRVQRVPGPSFDQAGGASFGLFERDAVTGRFTRQVATLRGGYGTTGDEVVFALPLWDLGLRSAQGIGRVSAFTAIGTFAGGAVRVLDSVELR